MQSRNKAVLIRLNENEKSHLMQQAGIAGLKIEPFLRSLIMRADLKPRPPCEYAKLLRELSAIGNNINQIAHISNISQNIDEVKINEACELIKKAWRYVKELG